MDFQTVFSQESKIISNYESLEETTVNVQMAGFDQVQQCNTTIRALNLYICPDGESNSSLRDLYSDVLQRSATWSTQAHACMILKNPEA